MCSFLSTNTVGANQLSQLTVLKYCCAIITLVTPLPIQDVFENRNHQAGHNYVNMLRVCAQYIFILLRTC